MRKYSIFANRDVKNFKTPKEIETFIEKEYGLFAICGVTVRDIWFLWIDSKCTNEQAHEILNRI